MQRMILKVKKKYKYGFVANNVKERGPGVTFKLKTNFVLNIEFHGNSVGFCNMNLSKSMQIDATVAQGGKLSIPPS